MKTSPMLRLLPSILLLFGLLPAEAKESISLKQTEKTISLMRGEKPILTYHIAEVPPPNGVDPIYNRSGFIYPMHAPSGGIVTGIHPDDHYHHIGLWHAWVNTKYDDKKGPDFWNLGRRTGRIRHAKVKETRDAGFTVVQEHLGYLDGIKAEPTVILNETLLVDAAFVGGANVIDYAMTQKNLTTKPLVFPAYRYGGGLAYRAPHSWNKKNSDYLTSEGLDRTNSHATRARWVAMHGPAEEAKGEDATVAILCHPKNHDAPQRIRTWDNGKVFFNYVPVQETGWSIQPGKSITLRYRIVILDGSADAKGIEARWKAYRN
ncbi:MAG: PmoA family protein [Verrucomicrobia bacterium]|nr:PmoA family protein [Verrucomicrobiota bacterium]